MNWKLIILLCVTFASLFQLLIHYLRLRSVRNPIPANVSDVYDYAAFKRWTEYNREKVRLSFISDAVTWLVTCLLLALDAHAAFARLFPANLLESLVSLVIDAVLLS